MSILKFVNGKNNDRDFLYKKRNYLTDPVKTNGGTLVGYHGCFANHDLADWMTVKKQYHKSGGRQGEHSVLSVTCGKKAIDPCELMNVAKEVIQDIYSGHQCIYVVHTDSKHAHIHMLANSVSYVNGNRYHIGNNQLAGFRLKVNKILVRHGYDQINSRADEIVDNTPYDLTNGFDCLEINNDEPYVDPFKDILAEPEDQYFEDEKVISHSSNIQVLLADNDEISASSNVYKNFSKEGYFMPNINSIHGVMPNTITNPTVSQQPTPYQYAGQTFTGKIPDNTAASVKNPNMSAVTQQATTQSFTSKSVNTNYGSNSDSALTDNQMLPASTTFNSNVPEAALPQEGCQLYPQVNSNGLPELNFNLSSPIKMKLPFGTPADEVRKLIRAATPYNKDIDPYGAGMTIMKSLQDNGVYCNVGINMFPSIDLDFSSSTYTSCDNNCIYQPDILCDPTHPCAPCNQGQPCARCQK